MTTNPKPKVEIAYRGYTLYVHPTLKQFGNRVCFIKQSGLTVTKVFGKNPMKAIDTARGWVDWRIKND